MISAGKFKWAVISRAFIRTGYYCLDPRKYRFEQEKTSTRSIVHPPLISTGSSRIIEYLQLIKRVLGEFGS